MWQFISSYGECSLYKEHLVVYIYCYLLLLSGQEIFTEINNLNGRDFAFLLKKKKMIIQEKYLAQI